MAGELILRLLKRSLISISGDDDMKIDIHLTGENNRVITLGNVGIEMTKTDADRLSMLIGEFLSREES